MCVRPSPRQSPVNPTSWYSCPCVMYQGLVNSALLSFGSLDSGEPVAIFWGHSGSAVKRSSLQDTVASRQQPCEWPYWKQIFSPSQAFRWLLAWSTVWLQPHKKSWPRNTHLSHSLIPNPEKFCEIISVCCFKLLDLGVTCYAAINN